MQNGVRKVCQHLRVRLCLRRELLGNGGLGKLLALGAIGGAAVGLGVRRVGVQGESVLFQQGGAPRGEPDGVKMQRALHGLKLLFGPHLAVFFHPRGTLGVPHLHRGKIGARQRALHTE